MKKCFGLFLGLLALTACSKLTLENYDKLHAGMSFEEVGGIIGKPDACSEVLVGRVCVWGTEEEGISATFVAGKLLTTSAKNLK